MAPSVFALVEDTNPQAPDWLSVRLQGSSSPFSGLHKTNRRKQALHAGLGWDFTEQCKVFVPGSSHGGGPVKVPGPDVGHMYVCLCPALT